MNSISKSFSAIAWNLAGGIGKAIAQLIIQIILARILGPAVFGQYAIVLSILGIGWLIADSGFGAALIQKSEINDDDVGYALSWILLVGSSIGLVVFFLAEKISILFGDVELLNVLQLCGLLVLLQAISNLPASLMRRNLMAKQLQIISLTSYVIGFGLFSIALALNNMGIWSLVVGFFVQTVISILTMYFYVGHKIKLHWSGDRNIRIYGLKVVATNLSNWAVENIDRLLIGKFWGAMALGGYTVMLNLSRAPVSMLVGSIQSVLFASGSKIKEDKNKLKISYLSIINLIMLFAVPLFVIIYLSANEIVYLIYGNKWAAAVPLFKSISLSTPLYILAAISGSFLWALDAVEKEFKIQIFVFIFLVIGLWSVKSINVDKAIWVIFVIYLIRSLMLVKILSSILSISIQEFFLSLKGAGIVTSVVLVVWITVENAFGDSAVIRFLNICSSIILFFITLILSRGRLLSKGTLNFLESNKYKSNSIKYFMKIQGI